MVWDGDAKAVQQCLTDIFTSVFTTCDIPAHAIFGPCALSHTSLYDSIAFLALKSTDKRAAPYIFRVSPGVFLHVSSCRKITNIQLCIYGNARDSEPLFVCAAQVDTSAANSTSEGLMWLRLVQSARDKEEQNLEAYVKNGQLFYRSLRRIEKDEELLVWYGADLIDLLLLSSSRAPAKSKGEQVPAVFKQGVVKDFGLLMTKSLNGCSL